MVALTYPYQGLPEFEIYDFVGITSDSYLELRSSFKDPLTQPVKHLLTARQRGLYDGNDQSNIRNMYSLMEASDAKKAANSLGMEGRSSDFGFLGLGARSSLPLWNANHIFYGSIILALRGVLVVVSWYLNSFWTLFEFAMSNAAIISKTDIIRVHRELVHADVLVVYLSLVGLLSAAIRERIDPSLAIFLFEIIHENRLSLIRVSPAIRKEVVTYSDKLFILGDSYVSPVVDAMSPLDYWTAFQIPKKDATFLAASFFPKITLLGTIALYATLRKIYRYYNPDDIRQRSSQSAEQSANEKTALSLKGSLTNFEISTGAELQTRFGIISDYKNYVYFKGMEFASADGVYCSGYVIINGKFLIKSKALL
ncbi:unnamed protein product [Phytophthora fragariaefolia]|uniref:Unnamed protein product n=1 Tax=Phytophthora fragariaefolia TaxID=1490495 RepID=A0A9W6YFT8_9STRA|nr:unnamed protein product [Phytophthora fragariaefolia]